MVVNLEGKPLIEGDIIYGDLKLRHGVVKSVPYKYIGGGSKHRLGVSYTYGELTNMCTSISVSDLRKSFSRTQQEK